MGRQMLKYGAGLIALYVVVYNGSKAGKVFLDGASGGSQIVRTFQGR